jgi:hypothetical protein
MAGERSFAKFGAQLADLQDAAVDRLEDAKVLLHGNRHASSIAMGLYALEISLKVMICKWLDLDALPTAFEIHDFEGLLILSGLSKRLLEPQFIRVKANWDFVTAYKAQHINELRYSPDRNYGAIQASEILNRLQALPDGVLPWLSAQP